MVDSTKRRKGKNAPPIEYPNIPSSIAPVPHNTTELPVPQPPTRDQPYHAETSSEDSKKEEGAPSSSSSSVVCRPRPVGDERCPYYLNQEDINDLIQKMALTKSNAELLISKLKQWDLLDEGVRITSRGRSIVVFPCFSLLGRACAITMI